MIGEKLSTGKVLVDSIANPSQCPRCHRQIWTALVIGFPVKVEPTPLNLEDELKERLAGRMVFQTRRVVNAFELEIRKAHHITNPKPNTYALATHDCNRPGLQPIVDFYKNPTTTQTEGIPF